MTDLELLSEVKNRLNITGTYQDKTLLGYIDDTKNYIFDAGVSQSIINSSVSVGVIVRGVSDLWNYGMGTATFSEYFYQRVIQLKYKELIPELEELVIISYPGSTIGTTQIEVCRQSENPIFRYITSASSIDLPKLNDDLSAWKSWDGVSDIEAEDGFKICIAEVTSENLAQKAGTTIANVNLG